MSTTPAPPSLRIAPRRILLGDLVLWGAVLYGTLSLAQIEWSAGRLFCGPWGCLPPLPALLACHAGWLVVLAPAALFLNRRGGQRWARSLNWAMIALGLSGLVFTGWWAASDWLRLTNGDSRCLVRHILMELASTIDYPLFELIAVGIVGLVHLRLPSLTNPTAGAGSASVRSTGQAE